MSTGVIYMLTGQRHAPLLAVSLWTLRTRGEYKGPVTLLHGDGEGHLACLWLADDKRLGPIDLKAFAASAERGSGWSNKTMMGKLSPYDQTIFLDADTAVLRPGVLDLTPEVDEVMLTWFADWRSNGGRIASRVEKWRDVAEAEVKRMHDGSYPAINTGVLSFGYQSSFMPAWREMTMRKPGSFICDEIAAQLIFPSHKHRIASDHYNYSPIYSPRIGYGVSEAVVVHFHGKKHLRKEAGRIIWEPLFREAYNEDVGGLQHWPLNEELKEIVA